jgi:carbon monoxide dehydrogenase subunit G
MQFNGEFEVAASRHDVYSFISDIERITGIIPDVISSEKIDESSSRVVAKAGVSFIKGKFNLTLEIKEKLQDDSVRIAARGSGSGGSVDLKASYTLVDADHGATAIRWVVEMNLGGVMASMGSRVINGAAEKYIKTLTDSFQKEFSHE